MTRTLAVIGLMGLLLTRVALSAEVFLEKVEGTWQGGGEVRGMSSQQAMVWSTVLGGQFTHLEFDNRMRQSEESEYRFMAKAFYKSEPDGRVTGHWFDSRGVEFPLHGTQTASSLTIEWGTPETELGRTEYKLVDDGLKITDEVLGADGEWKVFGSSELNRNWDQSKGTE